MERRQQLNMSKYVSSPKVIKGAQVKQHGFACRRFCFNICRAVFPGSTLCIRDCLTCHGIFFGLGGSDRISGRSRKKRGKRTAVS